MTVSKKRERVVRLPHLQWRCKGDDAGVEWGGHRREGRRAVSRPSGCWRRPSGAVRSRGRGQDRLLGRSWLPSMGSTGIPAPRTPPRPPISRDPSLDTGPTAWVPMWACLCSFFYFLLQVDFVGTVQQCREVLFVGVRSELGE